MTLRSTTAPGRPGEGERGSIPLALLMAIVAGGLITTVFAVTIAGQRATRFDEEFSSALHVAEEGSQQALYRLRTGQLNPGDADSGEVSGHSYEWRSTAYVEDAAGELEPVEGEFATLDIHEGDVVRWEIASTGSVRDMTRTVEVDVEVLPLFDLAVFTDQVMDLGGTNIADSYRSTDGVWCTGSGRLGTNDVTGGFQGGGQAICPYEDADGNVTWDQNNVTNDGVDLFNWADDPDPARCEQGSGGAPNNCWWDGATPRYRTHDEYRSTDPDLAWLTDELSQCASTGDYVVSEDATEQGDHYVIDPAPASNRELPWGDGTNYYCVDSVEFDADTVINGTSDDPVVFVTDGSIEVSQNKTVVNCQQDGGGLCPPGNQIDGDQLAAGGLDGIAPDAGALQIFSSGDTGTVFDVRQQSVFAAAVYMPRGACDGGAGVDLFGSLVCGEMDNVGNWRFHYDEALRDLIVRPDYRVAGWRETGGDE